MKFKYKLLILLFFSILNNALSQITGIKIIGDTCNNFTFQIQVTGTSSSPYFFWNFDDPQSGTNDTITITGLSASPFPTHTFSGPGTYNLCAQFQEPGQAVSIVCRTISIGLCCSASIVANDSCLQNNISFSVLSDSTINSVTWDFNDPSSGTNNNSSLINPQHQFSSTGSFNVTALIQASCGTLTISQIIQIVDCQSPCEGSIQIFDTCQNATSGFQIIANSNISSISWNFGDVNSGINNTSSNINPTHIFSSAGNYLITATISADCGVFTTSLPVTIVDCSTNSNCYGTIQNSNTCKNELIYFEINSNNNIDSVKWNFGDLINNPNNFSNLVSPFHVYTSAGDYLVSAVIFLACGTDTINQLITIIDCDSLNNLCNIFVPNTFTPNKDSTNDFFAPNSFCTPEFYELTIFNRWGEVVFKSQDPLEKWDGKYKELDCSDGVYIYKIQYKFPEQEMIIKHGFVTLLR